MIRVTSAVIRVTRQSVQSHCDSHSQPTPGGEGLQCASGDLASESRCAQTAAIAARARSPDAPPPPAILSRAQGPGRMPVTGPGRAIQHPPASRQPAAGSIKIMIIHWLLAAIVPCRALPRNSTERHASHNQTRVAERSALP